MTEVYGEKLPAFGDVMFGVWITSRPQAQLMLEILQREMRERAGKPEETLLAKWHNDIIDHLRKAGNESWPGWTEETS